MLWAEAPFFQQFRSKVWLSSSKAKSGKKMTFDINPNFIIGSVLAVAIYIFTLLNIKLVQFR